MKTQISILFILLSWGLTLNAQGNCGDGKIIINGDAIDAVSFDGNNKQGVKLPLWLNSGSTIAAGDRVKFVSIIEFIEEPQSSGVGNTLVYNQVLTVGTTPQTVPANRVWKIESLIKYENPFANGITPSNTSPICDGDNVTLNATTVSGATYSWTGPNGFSSSNQNPTISNATLAANGTYVVTANLNGCSYTDSTTIIVDTLPNSNFTNSPYPIANYNVTFYPDVPGMNYSWTFASGTPATDNVENPVVQWSSANNYNVTLIATDGNGCSSATTNSVTVNNCQANQPQSDFSWSPASAGYAVTFTPDDGTALTYTWIFDQGTSSMTNAQTPNDVVWANPGTYDVTLVTTFAGNCYTTTQQVTVSNCQIGQSESDFSWTSPAIVGNAVTFTPDDGAALSYAWTFDQGTSSMTNNQTPNDVVWANGGTYDVTLLTTFAGGCFMTTQQVQIYNSQIFSYTGTQQTFTIPSGVTNVFIEAWGANGHASTTGYEGKGGYVNGELSVTPTQIIYIYVGEVGTTPTSVSANTWTFNGGGKGYPANNSSYGSGGGASDIRAVGGVWDDLTSLGTRVIVAGGGGAGRNNLTKEETQVV